MIRSEIEKHGLSAKGRREVLKHLDGGRLTMKQMIQAKCYDCMGFYADGKVDCKIPSCPLYPVMPYREGVKRAFIERSKTPFNGLVDTQEASTGIFSGQGT